VLQFVVVVPSCGVEVRVEDGVVLELLFQVWSRPGWQERPTKQLSHLEIILPLVSDSF
jgi:hypothetical protein